MDTNAKISKNPEKILAKIAEKSPFDSAALKAIEIMGARPVHAFMFGCLDVLMMMTLQSRAPTRASRSPSSSGSALCSQGTLAFEERVLSEKRLSGVDNNKLKPDLLTTVPVGYDTLLCAVETQIKIDDLPI